MSQESPEMNESTPESSHQIVSEISREEFQEMLDQLPVLREMLSERETELRRLQTEHVPNAFEIMRLRQEVSELKEEISGREEFAQVIKASQMRSGDILMPSRDESEPTGYAGREPEFSKKSVVLTDENEEVVIVDYLADKGLYVVAGKARPLFRISPDRLRPLKQQIQ